ncbi:unnamed protein product [Lactuca virosa]|uniref:O-fucosyltransferase family protein n=1 Tax=Lactuca virosa TaxID=75947 RepID=A0AAU9PSM8_9ASTR|nr:unnamed protein product [Lactuca virosa]
METLNFNNIRTNRFRRKPTNTHRSKQLLFISLLAIFFVLLFCFSNKYTINSLFLSNPLKNTRFSQCVKPNDVQSLKGQKFLWYAPHSGFNNQLSEFKNVVLMSAILNRALIIPPVLDHHAVVLGSCPKFRKLEHLHTLSPSYLSYSIKTSLVILAKNSYFGQKS